jgi:hypothetical protein
MRVERRKVRSTFEGLAADGPPVTTSTLIGQNAPPGRPSHTLPVDVLLHGVPAAKRANRCETVGVVDVDIEEISR